MTVESPVDVKFEIGHVLFMDVVGYSKLLITEQSELLRELTAVVRETEPSRPVHVWRTYLGANRKHVRNRRCHRGRISLMPVLLGARNL
jgi:hypothetical protein